MFGLPLPQYWQPKFFLITQQNQFWRATLQAFVLFKACWYTNSEGGKETGSKEFGRSNKVRNNK